MDENPPAGSDAKNSGSQKSTSQPETRDSNNSAAGPASPANPPSLTSRIQSSAANLLQNTFLNPQSSSLANSLTSGLSGVLGSASKPGPLQTHGRPVGESPSHSAIDNLSRQRNGSSAANTSAGGNATLESESFRSIGSHTAENTEDQRLWRQFEEQMNVEESLFTPDVDDAPSKGKGKAKAENEHSSSTFDSTPTKTFTFESAWSESEETAQEVTTDGSAVLSLLSDSSFDPLTPSSLPDSPVLAPHADTLITTTTTTKTKTKTTTTIKTTADLSPLSLLPDIQSLLALSLPSSELTTIPTVSEWLDLDSAYTDAVWGGMLKTYTEDARREVEQRRQELGAEADVDANAEVVYGGPAVRRLGMVLGHLRGKMETVDIP